MMQQVSDVVSRRVQLFAVDDAADILASLEAVVNRHAAGNRSAVVNGLVDAVDHDEGVAVSSVAAIPAIRRVDSTLMEQSMF